MTTPIFSGRDAPYIHTDELADLLNRAERTNVWGARKVRRWLDRAGAAVRLPGNGRRPVVTTRERLRTVFPELYESILRSLPEGEDD